jgi:crotonobetainyl-CoA:carnitine CoA-transferase CaiB-like acyl-CoA transferase
VIELGQMLAGPFAGHLLADLGAEVIKVEPPGRGDPMRTWGHASQNGEPLWWASLARNKKCVSLNLRTTAGQEVLKRLVAKSDVVIENFRPGALEKWGLGPDSLWEHNPKVIIGRISGYGQTGPYADRVGFASAGEAMGGLRYLNGYPDQPPPRAGISLGDSLAGMFAVQGVLAALYHRDATGGPGQVVDASIVESCFALLEGTLTEYGKLGAIRGPSGTGMSNIAPSNIYRSADGKWTVIAANADTLFRRLCAAIGQPGLADDPRFATHVARGTNAAELDQIISDWAATQEAAEIDRLLTAHGVVVSPIYDISDIASDPHFVERDMILNVEDPVLGPLLVPGFVPKMTATPGTQRWTGPARVGEHNDHVYGDLLGIGPEERAELAAEGVI